MRKSRAILVMVAVGLSVVLTACSKDESKAPESSVTTTPAVDPNAPEANDAGDIPDDQVFVPYSPNAAGYTVTVPEGWARTQVGGAVTFTDKLNSIRLETVAAATAPTIESAKRDEVPAIEKASTKYEAGKVSQVKRTAGTAVMITYKTDGKPNEVTNKVIHLDVERYEFWKNGTQAILTLSGPVGADNVDPWKIVTDSFVWS